MKTADKAPPNRPLLTQWPLIAVALLSWIGYLLAALVFDFYSTTADVVRFLLLFGLLFGLYFWIVFRRPATHASKGQVIHVLVWAAIFRLTLIFAGLPAGAPLTQALKDVKGEEVVFERFLLYDHDIWRYLWDGHLSAAGHSPYAKTPAEWVELAWSGDEEGEALFSDPVWEDIHDFVDYQGYTTIYPPVAQGFFRFSHWLAPGSVLVMKCLIALLDLGVCLILAALLRRLGRDPAESLLYAWNPLVIKEYAGSGHLDPLMLFFLVLAYFCLLQKRPRAALLSFGVAVSAKITPIVLGWFFLRRTPWQTWPFAALGLLPGYLVYKDSLVEMAAGLAAFGRDWQFNPGLWGLFRWFSDLLYLPPLTAKGLSALCLLTAIGYTAWRDTGKPATLFKGSFLVLATLVLTSPAVMPWYLPWVLLLAVPAGIRSWTAITFLALLSYLIYIDQREHSWWLWLEHGTFFLILAMLWGRNHLRRRSHRHHLNSPEI